MCLTRFVVKSNLKYLFSELKSHLGYLANSVDPDQPASEEAG